MVKPASKTTIANQPPCETGWFLVAIDKAAMVSTPTKLVHRWVGENLGLTVQSKRTQLARILRTNTTGKPQEA